MAAIQVCKGSVCQKIDSICWEDTKRVWEDKIHVHEVPVCSSDYSNIFEKLPITWKQIIQPGNTIRKQIILYDISSASFVQGRECALQKLKETLEFFEGKRDTVALIWRRNMVTEDVLSALEPEIYKQYQEMVAEYKRLRGGFLTKIFPIGRKWSLRMLITGTLGMCRAIWRHLKNQYCYRK